MKIKRYKNNPIVSPEPTCEWGSGRAMNAGVVFDGKTFHMVFTASKKMSRDNKHLEKIINEDRTLLLGYASSTDGFNFVRREEPFMRPSENEGDFDWGTVDDVRITELEGKYYITYGARANQPLKLALHGYVPKNIPNKRPIYTQCFRSIGLAETIDFNSYNKLGLITSEFVNDNNVCIFPEKINGKYVRLHRPTPFLGGVLGTYYCPSSIFIQFSKSLTEWNEDDDDIVNRVPKNDFLLIRPEQKWEQLKIGGAGIPIKTDEGWLTMYHAKDLAGDYRCGLLLLDLEDPRKVLARTPHPVFVPEEYYETSGRRPNTIFPCAHIVVGDEVYIYYGASDEFVAVATVKLKDMLDEVLKYRIK